jgi:hypothetical protein
MGVGTDFSLLTREGCHLCDEMEAVLRRALGPDALRLEKVDVDEDPELRERFGDIVPVLLRDGVPVAKVRLTERQARRLAARSRRPPPPPRPE